MICVVVWFVRFQLPLIASIWLLFWGGPTDSPPPCSPVVLRVEVVLFLGLKCTLLTLPRHGDGWEHRPQPLQSTRTTCAVRRVVRGRQARVEQPGPAAAGRSGLKSQEAHNGGRRASTWFGARCSGSKGLMGIACFGALWRGMLGKNTRFDVVKFACSRVWKLTMFAIEAWVLSTQMGMLLTDHQGVHVDDTMLS